MKKILGIDLGVGSMGWSLILVDENNNPVEILGMGVRVIDTNKDDLKSFNSKDGETACKKRTTTRGARRNLDRFQQRRGNLTELLNSLGMVVNENLMTGLSPLELWELRSKAVTQQISLSQLGRVLLHINSKRGYKHSRSDGSDESNSKLVEKINSNFAEIKNANLTVGQYFYNQLRESETVGTHGGKSVSFRVKNNIFPRKAYYNEASAILTKQSEYYPDVLTPDVITDILHTIFYQRPLKSCKHLVNYCEFSTREYTDAEGNRQTAHIKVAPRTSPLSQIVRIWESINNIRLTNPANINAPTADADLLEKSQDLRMLQHVYPLTAAERKAIFEALNTKEKLSKTALYKLLGLKARGGFEADALTANGLQGNKTLIALRSALGDGPEADKLLQFDIPYATIVDEETGEEKTVVSPNVINQPLYQLWHTIYSINNTDELAEALRTRFNITNQETIDALCNIDFVKDGYTNRSTKFMRQLLPLLEQGMGYAEASAHLGINHSNSITSEENEARELQSKLELLPKGELRQPVVEKVLNQMVNTVNALIDKYGEIDEVRVELARELRQSKDQRINTEKSIRGNEKRNEEIRKSIKNEFNINPSINTVTRHKLWTEAGMKCFYCGKRIGQGFLKGEAEIEHVIPRSLFFDNSYSNKVCACRECNREKGNLTAYDYMMRRGEKELENYVKRVNEMFEDKKISKTKRDRLLTPGDKIPDDFLNRDLTLTQYIARKACDILSDAIRNVTMSTGRVTDFLRHTWGYDDILHSLNIDRYALAGQVKDETFTHEGQEHTRQRIQDWSKRLDHRHHAIDALTVALTRQGYIQRLNTLNASHEDIFRELSAKGQLSQRGTIVDKWARTLEHFSVADVTSRVARIAISSKDSERLATHGKRYTYRGGKRQLKQERILCPRGPLHEETIYGDVMIADDGKMKIEKAIKTPGLIANEAIRRLAIERLTEYDGDTAKAIKSLKKEPLTLNGVTITEVTMLKPTFVTRKKLDSLNAKQVENIVDKTIRDLVRQRFDECGGNDKKFVQSLAENPIISPAGHAIKKVRLKYGNSVDSMIALRHDAKGHPTGYAASGSNHHLAIYDTEDGWVETVVSTWTAIKRYRMGLDPVITNVDRAWEIIEKNSIDDIDILASMPPLKSRLVMTMHRGQRFILGLTDEQISDAIATNDMATLTAHLYKVQKLSAGNYTFRLHTDTSSQINKDEQSRKSVYNIRSQGALKNLNPKPVKISLTGEIIW